MDTERWKTLLTALDTGSLCAAGEALGYTVSGVSRSVAALEAELGFALLYRGKNGVSPTPACQQPLRRDPLWAVVPAGHPLAMGTAVPLEAFRTEPYIETCPGLDIDSSRMFARNGIRPNACFSTVDIQATYAMVGAGLGISVSNRINSDRTDPDVCHLPLDPPQEVELGIACGRELPPAAQAFWEYLQPHLPLDVD